MAVFLLPAVRWGEVLGVRGFVRFPGAGVWCGRRRTGGSPAFFCGLMCYGTVDRGSGMVLSCRDTESGSVMNRPESIDSVNRTVHRSKILF